MFTEDDFAAMEAAAKRALATEAWRMAQKAEAEVPSGAYGGEAEWPGEGETLADLRRFCPVTDPWVSWEAYEAETSTGGRTPRASGR